MPGLELPGPDLVAQHLEPHSAETVSSLRNVRG